MRVILYLLLSSGVLLSAGCESNGAALDPPEKTADSPADSARSTTRDATRNTARDATRDTRGRLLPVDEADEDPSFFAFRMQLMQAVAGRDEKALLEHLADDVHLSFGGDGGKEDFRRMWRPADPETELWTVLGRILSGGGAFYDTPEYKGPPMFQAPYYYALFPGEEFDPFTHGAILGDAVPARASAGASAAIVDTLSFNIVKVEDFSPVNSDWIRVRIAAGPAFVPRTRIASPIGYRAIFQKSEAGWKLTALVAGD